MDDEGNRFQVWLDCQANYAFRRVMNISPKGPRVETQVSEYSEPKRGIFVPAKAERIVFGASKSIINVTDIKINESVEPSVFSTAVRPGTVVLNRADGRVYKAGPQGTPDTVVGQIAEAAPTAEAPMAATPLAADTPGWWSPRRIGLIVSALLGIGALAVILRRRATARDATRTKRERGESVLRHSGQFICLWTRPAGEYV
jgi:hypothetical protein